MESYCLVLQSALLLFMLHICLVKRAFWTESDTSGLVVDLPYFSLHFPCTKYGLCTSCTFTTLLPTTCTFRTLLYIQNFAVHSQLCYPPRYTIFYPDFTDYEVASSLRSLNDNDATVLTARAPCIISLTATKVFSFYVLLLNFAILIALNVCLVKKYNPPLIWANLLLFFTVLCEYFRRLRDPRCVRFTLFYSTDSFKFRDARGRCILTSCVITTWCVINFYVVKKISLTSMGFDRTIRRFWSSMLYQLSFSARRRQVAGGVLSWIGGYRGGAKRRYTYHQLSIKVGLCTYHILRGHEA